MNHLDSEIKNFLKEKSGMEVSDELMKIQEKLFNTCASGISGVEDEDGVYVKIKLNALQQLQKIEIGDGAIKSGSKVAAALVKAAYDQALEELKNIAKKEMIKDFGNFNS